MDPIKSVRPPPVSFPTKLLRSKALVVTLIVLPGLWPAWPLFRQDPSVLADPLKYILHHLGFIACVLLAVVLTFTPLRVLFPKSGLVQALNRHRRLVGVSAFFYALLHLATHLLYEGGFGILASDIKKPFLLTGLVAFSILLVLAITSLNRAVRWLGGQRWKKLHRLAYLAAALVAYHQAAARKIFPVQVLWIFVPLILLELLRIIRQAMQKRTTAATVAR
jgi:sulfoxide reductase heme-binding subunit YedZ